MLELIHGGKKFIVPPAPAGTTCCCCSEPAEVRYRPRYRTTDNYCFFCFLGAFMGPYRILPEIPACSSDPNPVAKPQGP